MNELVKIENQKVVTTSLKVAEEFGKEHFHVMRDINNLLQMNIKDPSKIGCMFNKSHYEDRYGRFRIVLMSTGTVLCYLLWGLLVKKL